MVYENLPENLRVKPTLVVKLDNQNDGSKDLTLNYLTNGLSWQANYVAEITSDSQMDLQGWVTLNNQSGADYKAVSYTHLIIVFCCVCCLRPKPVRI